MRRRVKRPYDATARRAKAEASRGRIVAAARGLFESRGYVATTMEAVADAAGVSVETVYKAFGSKLTLLQRVIDVDLAGDEEHISLPERPLFLKVRDEPDQRRQVELLAHNARIVLERAGPLQWTVLAAADREPDLAEVVRRYNTMRLASMTRFIEWVSARGPLRAGITVEEAALTYWTVSSTEVHHLLRTVGGLSADQYERWLSNNLQALLLAPKWRR